MAACVLARAQNGLGIIAIRPHDCTVVTSSKDLLRAWVISKEQEAINDDCAAC